MSAKTITIINCVCFAIPMIVAVYDLLLQPVVIYDFMFELVRMSIYSSVVSTYGTGLLTSKELKILFQIRVYSKYIVGLHHPVNPKTIKPPSPDIKHREHKRMFSVHILHPCTLLFHRFDCVQLASSFFHHPTTVQIYSKTNWTQSKPKTTPTTERRRLCVGPSDRILWMSVFLDTPSKHSSHFCWPLLTTSPIFVSCSTSKLT